MKDRLINFLHSIFSEELIEEVSFFGIPHFVCWDSLFSYPVLEVRQDMLVLDTGTRITFIGPYHPDYSFAFTNPEE